ncbi:hypothetical protein BKA67DRAFT_692612 [Truncatella angustata]|uniref:Uncharacterized protein n=1 Tax=Truncatella angustata TaxID=152316 RepID=A0A9P8UK12_9PEZI|nr:uncharacterized protein BKA67DRAFT_692612 [Truncatella angustata]KAH6653428.1 hypothetical protein BKA67DRAFT_692612 [Truncatella angustata]
MDSQIQWEHSSRVEKEKEARKRHETWDTVIVSPYIIGEMAKPKPAFIQLSMYVYAIMATGNPQILQDASLHWLCCPDNRDSKELLPGQQVRSQHHGQVAEAAFAGRYTGLGHL